MVYPEPCKESPEAGKIRTYSISTFFWGWGLSLTNLHLPRLFNESIWPHLKRTTSRALTWTSSRAWPWPLPGLSSNELKEGGGGWGGESQKWIPLDGFAGDAYKSESLANGPVIPTLIHMKQMICLRIASLL